MTRQALALAAGAVALIGGAGFTAGRASKRTPPAEVKTVEKVRTEYRDRVEWKDRVVTVAGKDRIIRKVVRVVEKADGSKETIATTDDATTERQTTSADRQATREVAATQTTERVVHVVQREAWALSVMGGVSSGVVLGRAPSPFVGAEVSRLVGPLRLGVVVIKPATEVPRVGVTLGIVF